MRTAILGAGKMGVWFAKFCKEKGDNVILASRNAEKLAKLGAELGVETADFTQAVEAADRVMLCVSISSLEEVVKKIAPHVREGQAVMDICSIKEFPVKIMHENIIRGLVLGTHPLFGPGSKGVQNKTYILTPTNPKEAAYAEEFQKWLSKEGAHVYVMSPEKHDQLISVVLGLPHFLGLAACETLLEQPDFLETKQVAGTTYRMLFTLAEATALETPDLFANLQTKLPKIRQIEEQFIMKAQEWLDLIKQQDSGAIADRMRQLKQKLEKSDADFEKSYEVMYKMLESTEKE
ncbi:MAG: prephenate dehydrogenase/arogenate dehydrogenase family protein [Candidatus Bathyarchaeota archaeon]|nr:prephenate dehydrogenase/arogenate dehydrogenase family protein [Candidatus Bathyarchaeota archaeon]